MAQRDEVGIPGEPPANRHRRRWPHWLIGIGATGVLLVVAAVVAFIIVTRNPSHGEFYDPPDEVDAAAPGTILRSQPFTDGVPAGAQAWKVLYASTAPNGDPIAVSGLVIVSTDATPGPHPVLAWAHGTTGIARPCAPSLSGDPLRGIPDMTGPLERGWVLALTDYPGLGTPGPHPYLVGDSEGRAVLDSVRAAHQLETGIAVGDQYAIWGHSQGGHAALFAGQLANDYLPEYELAGVAALSPATQLQENLVATKGTEAGNMLSVFATESWTDVYPDIPDETLASAARRPAELIADACINQPSRLRIAVAGVVLPETVLAIDPTTNPVWTRRLDQNTPDPSGLQAPLFVAQGLADRVIAPEVTEAWTAARCDTNLRTDWKTYPEVNHSAVVGPGGTDALTWTIYRFNGNSPTTSCPSR